MINEHAIIRIDPDTHEAYEAAVRRAFPIIESAPECHGAELRRQYEDPAVYLLTVRWTSVEAHLRFRATPLFEQWRAATHPFYASPAEVTHFLEPIDRQLG